MSDTGVGDSEGFQRRDLTGGIDVVDNGIPLERERILLGYRDHVGSLEGICGSGKLSSKS